MAKGRIGVLEAYEPPNSAAPRTRCGRWIADYLVNRRHARRIGKRMIQMVNGSAVTAIKHAKSARDARVREVERIHELIMFWDGPLGRGNVLPFAKPHSSGDKLHYEIPMAGDRTAFSRSRRKRIHVSHLSFFRHQIMPTARVSA